MSDPTPEERAAAQEFAREHLDLDTSDLTDALIAAWKDAYGTGLLTSAQQSGAISVTALASVTVPTTEAEWAAFWSTWEPGNLEAAVKLDAGGLGQLLDQAAVTIKGITGSTLDRLGSLLAEGALNGDSPDTIADSLAELLNDPDRAFTIADTETARAVSAASQDQYGEQGVEQWEWLVSPDACDECQDNADSGPYPVGGGPDLPAHPLCRCSSSPVDPGAAQPGE